jgi:hypothetical protein
MLNRLLKRTRPNMLSTRNHFGRDSARRAKQYTTYQSTGSKQSNHVAPKENGPVRKPNRPV